MSELTEGLTDPITTHEEAGRRCIALALATIGRKIPAPVANAARQLIDTAIKTGVLPRETMDLEMGEIPEDPEELARLEEDLLDAGR